MDFASHNISIFKIFNIDIGFGSSLTMGPWKVAPGFANSLKSGESATNINHIQVYLFGFLALRGNGHGTDKAMIWGLTGCAENS